ncbi:MAG: CoA transferase [Acidimicrobiales bacterium]|nr:CoA transferase [Acidimicrobiales bacterium]MCB1261505.1 CoA transferase [Acidimicrobiales bacterium]
MALPLEGITVLEVDNWGFSPSAGTVLADWGADVIKVEPPGKGDPIRGIFGAVSFGEGSMVNFMHEQWNRNKRSMAIDLTSADGRALLDELIGRADVFLTNYLPPLRRKLQITADDVRSANPTIVYALATGQGSKGPDAERPSFDYISAWARAGVGERLTLEGGPLAAQRPGFVDTTAGNFLAGSIAAALLRRERFGEAVDVELSLLAAGAWMLGPDVANYLTNGFELPRGGMDGAGAGPMMTWYACGDDKRLVFCMMNPEAYLDQVLDALDRRDLLDDERFATAEARAANAMALRDALAATIAERPRHEWADRLDAHEVIWAPVQSPAELVEDRQVVANGYVLAFDRGEQGTTRVVSSPAQFDGEPIAARNPAPDLGQDTDDVLRSLGWDDARIAAARDAGVVG